MKKKDKILLLVLIAAAVALIVVPVVLQRGADFGGSDDAGSDTVGQIDEGYTPWATPILEKLLGGEVPPELETLLFCVQTGIGVGVVAFFTGRFVERRKQEKLREEEKRADKP
jgi:cobalt/nickel transport protein